jgi:hypothetical protein
MKIVFISNVLDGELMEDLVSERYMIGVRSELYI